MNTVRDDDDEFDVKVIDDIENVYTGWSFSVAPLFDVRYVLLHTCH